MRQAFDESDRNLVTTVVINLKGRIHQYGSALEYAPDDLVYVGRAMSRGGWRIPGSPLHNPFTVGTLRSRQESVDLYPGLSAGVSRSAGPGARPARKDPCLLVPSGGLAMPMCSPNSPNSSEQAGLLKPVRPAGRAGISRPAGLIGRGGHVDCGGRRHGCRAGSAGPGGAATSRGGPASAARSCARCRVGGSPTGRRDQPLRAVVGRRFRP